MNKMRAPAKSASFVDLRRIQKYSKSGLIMDSFRD